MAPVLFHLYFAAIVASWKKIAQLKQGLKKQ